jgi:hypothetical protein
LTTHPPLPAEDGRRIVPAAVTTEGEV